MVSLNNRMEFSHRVEQNTKITALKNLLYKKPIYRPDNKELHESDQNYYDLLCSISQNSKTSFQKAYQVRSKSKPNKDTIAPFVNDDYLIFSIILGVLKFSIEDTWIRYILSIRNRNQITLTFENILSGNYYSKSNLHEIVLCGLLIIDESKLNDELLNDTYQRIANSSTLFNNKNDFLILCAIKAYDFVIEIKEAPTGSEYYLVNKFKSKFLKRIKILSIVIHPIIWLIVLFGIFKVLSRVDSIGVFIEKYNAAFTIFGALGLSIFGNIIPKIRIKTFEILLFFFGYPKDLISMDKKDK